MSVSNMGTPRCGAPTTDATMSARATLQHIEHLHAKQARLALARDEAEEQLLHHVGSAYRSGDMGIGELIEAFNRYRALGLTGRSKRWNAAVDIGWHAMCSMADGLNGPEGTWVGEWPHYYDVPGPAHGVSVVYVLFDAANTPCYVGSTFQFTQRLNAHAKDGKRFVRWQAYPCRDREHAYQVEDRLLKQHKPYLNRKASR